MDCENKCGIYITERLFPLNNGGTLHDHGNCEFLSTLMHITAYSYSDRTFDIGCETASNESLEYRLFKLKTTKTYYTVLTKSRLIDNVDFEMLKAIEKEIEDTNVQIVFFTLKMSLYYRLLRKKFSSIKYIYISHNCEFINIKDDICNFDSLHKVNKLRHFFKIVRIPWFKSQEHYVITHVDKVFSISETDSDILAKQYHTKRSKFILCKPMIRFDSIANDTRWNQNNYSLLIVGNMSWYPTSQGTEWFIENVFNELTSEIPNLKLYIVGGGATSRIQKYSQGNKNIVVTGYVNSLDDYYLKCDIAVVPIFNGTGAKIKVLEGIAKSIPMVISDYAAKDYHGIESCAKVAKDKEEFISQIKKLIENEALRKACTDKEREYYSEYMSDSVPVKECIVSLYNAID